MRKSRSINLTYAISWILFVGLVVSAYFFRKHRLLMLTQAMVVLVIAYMAEQFLFRSRKGIISRSRAWIGLGSMKFNSRLVVDDKLDFSTAKIVEQLPVGEYQISVERFQKGGDHYVAAIALKGAHAAIAGNDFRIRMDVETGFLIFLNCEANEEILKNLRTTQDRILDDDSRDIDMELVYRSSEVVGFVAATGLGNGQYELEVINSGRELIVRFLEDLDEI